MSNAQIKFAIHWDIDYDYSPNEFARLTTTKPEGKWFVNRKTGVICSPSGETQKVKRKRNYESREREYYEIMNGDSFEDAERIYQLVEDIYDGNVMVELCEVSAIIEGFNLVSAINLGVINADSKEKALIEEELKGECIESLKSNIEKLKKIAAIVESL